MQLWLVTNKIYSPSSFSANQLYEIGPKISKLLVVLLVLLTTKLTTIILQHQWSPIIILQCCSKPVGTPTPSTIQCWVETTTPTPPHPTFEVTQKSILQTYTPSNRIDWILICFIRAKTALLSDARIRIMNEVISGIRVIKIYTWEPSFGNIVSEARRCVE